VIHFFRQQYRYGCSVGFGRRDAIKRAMRIYLKGFP
jgi:hypothetical protein